MTADGRTIVLTADRTLMAQYALLFDGMLAASQTTLTPRPMMDWLLAPRSAPVNGRAKVAPLGLRRMEATLRAAGYSADDVVVVDDAHLHEVIGPKTRVVGVSAGEPCGLGMSSTTMTGVTGGAIYPYVMTRKLLRKVRGLLGRHAPEARLVLGGPGAWQLAADDAKLRASGVDHVVSGYAEGNAAEVFGALAAGDELPAIIEGQGVAASEIPAICGASTMGVVEISRGCGLGCTFCTIGRERMQHLPVETVVADARTNLAAGMGGIAALSEDCFRYGGTGSETNPAALIELLEQLRQLDGLRLIQTDHANIMSIAGFSDEELAHVRELLVGDSGAELPWVNVGVETASGELLARSGGGAKMIGASHDEWGDICALQLRRLIAAGWAPMVSLLIGLPGETVDDVQRTLAWVRDMQHERVMIFPVVYAPIDGGEEVTRSALTRLHWRLVRECYSLNFKWTPRMYTDNQRAVGVSSTKRTLMQALGVAQVLEWKTLLAWRAAGARA